MDLNDVEAVLRPARGEDIAPDATPLAGGTWLFSEPQPGLRRLLDLAGLGWDRLEPSEAGLHIGAMCTFRDLGQFAAPPAWRAARLFPRCCDALVASFKVQEVATVGGNLCLALPAGPVAALAVALDGVCLVRGVSGSERRVAATNFVTGDRRTMLAPGELLRAIHLPARSLCRPAAFRRLSLSPTGRSAALVIGTAGDRFALTVTAATTRPVHLVFPGIPGAATLQHALGAAIPDALLHDDVHGDPAWRRHVAEVLAEEIRQELGDAACS
ncbi:MAG: FAD binding domain-containing protein [Acetobacteraceae bacterium]|nr:FAD binding domain-containing protein [Acetobacteraceae bacterium]